MWAFVAIRHAVHVFTHRIASAVARDSLTLRENFSKWCITTCILIVCAPRLASAAQGAIRCCFGHVSPTSYIETRCDTVMRYRKAPASQQAKPQGAASWCGQVCDTHAAQHSHALIDMSMYMLAHNSAARLLYWMLADMPTPSMQK